MGYYCSNGNQYSSHSPQGGEDCCSTIQYRGGGSSSELRGQTLILTLYNNNYSVVLLIGPFVKLGLLSLTLMEFVPHHLTDLMD